MNKFGAIWLLISSIFLITAVDRMIENSAFRRLDDDKYSPQNRSWTEGAHREIVHLRGLYFGTSRTWGTGLEKEKHEVYPWKVSLNITNLAMRGTGPLFCSMCFKSMVGENARFDYVVFEYYELCDGVEARLIDLAKRVRARFPDALIIFLMIPLPGFFFHEPTSSTLPQYLSERDFPFISGDYSTISHEMMDDLLVDSDGWRILFPIPQTAHVRLAAKAVNGHIWQPLDFTSVSSQEVRRMTAMFFRDGNHYNANGHTQIALAIRNILLFNNATRSDRIGPWDAYDNCDSWYQNGVVKILHSPMNMYQWANANSAESLTDGKHALEVRPTASWIKVHNPTTRPLNLYLFYMVTAPEQYYPLVNVTVSADPSVTIVEASKKILPTVTIHVHIAQEYHIIKGSYLNKVGPGDHYITLQPVQIKERPFRITGVALSEHGDSIELEGYFQ